MGPLLKRLLTGSAAYQAASLLSAALAVLTLPLYLRHLSTADYGYAETLLTAIIFGSILLRAGVGEAFVRFWFDDEDPGRRRALARTVTAWTLATSTAAAALLLAFAGPLSEALLRTRDATLLGLGVLGLWAFSNLEVAYALLRVEERRRHVVILQSANVLLTVALTVVLVVVLDMGARGYVLGNYGASTVVLLAIWARERDRVGLRLRRPVLGPLLRFGGPTVPADAAVFALNVIDRSYLLRVESPGAAGLYAVAVKLATVVILAVRGFQAAWPPLAYSVTDPVEARRLYALVTSLYVLVTGTCVVALTLLGRWLVRLLGPPEYYPAHEALPWMALGWALYGLHLLLITVAGRAKVTSRNLPAAAAGLAVNVLLLVLLVEPLGIAGAGIALCGAYVVLIAVLQGLTRRLFPVPFEWRRLAVLVLVLGGTAVSGEELLPSDGADGLALRAAWLALVPALLVLTRWFTPGERRRIAAALRRRPG